MSRRPVVPILDLAQAYVAAVESGRPPVRALMRFGLSYEQAAKRAERMRIFGWLPPGPADTGLWLAAAQQMLAEREDAQLRRAQILTARDARRAPRLYRRQLAETVSARVRSQHAQVRQVLLPAQAHLPGRAPRVRTGVLDLFG